LVAERLPAAGRHKGEYVPPVCQGFDDLLLIGSEGVEAEDVGKDRFGCHRIKAFSNVVIVAKKPTIAMIRHVRRDSSSAIRTLISARSVFVTISSKTRERASAWAGFIAVYSR